MPSCSSASKSQWLLYVPPDAVPTQCNFVFCMPITTSCLTVAYSANSVLLPKAQFALQLVTWQSYSVSCSHSTCMVAPSDTSGQEQGKVWSWSTHGHPDISTNVLLATVPHRNVTDLLFTGRDSHFFLT